MYDVDLKTLSYDITTDDAMVIELPSEFG